MGISFSYSRRAAQAWLRFSRDLARLDRSSRSNADAGQQTRHHRCPLGLQGADSVRLRFPAGCSPGCSGAWCFGLGPGRRRRRRWRRWRRSFSRTVADRFDQADGSGRKVLTRRAPTCSAATIWPTSTASATASRRFHPTAENSPSSGTGPPYISQQVMLADRDGWGNRGRGAKPKSSRWTSCPTAGSSSPPGITATDTAGPPRPSGSSRSTPRPGRKGFRLEKVLRQLQRRHAPGPGSKPRTSRCSTPVTSARTMTVTTWSSWIRNLVSGAERVLVTAPKRARSPDGERVAFTKMCVDTEGYAHCAHSGDGRTGVWTIGVDGSDRQLIVTGDGGYSSPDWGWAAATSSSPAAGTSRRSGRTRTEIYSVRSDGECLTWLTNGSPESVMPAWRRRPRCEPTRCEMWCGRTQTAGGEARPPRAIDTDPARATGPGRSSRTGCSQGRRLRPGRVRFPDLPLVATVPFFDSSVAGDRSRSKLPSPAVASARSVPPRGRGASDPATRSQGNPALGQRENLSLPPCGPAWLTLGIGQSMLDVEDIGGRASTFSGPPGLHRQSATGRQGPLDPGSKLPPAAMVQVPGPEVK